MQEMNRIFKIIKNFYKNESYEEEKIMKIATTLFIILLLLITPVITHFKNVYWQKQYEKADERVEMDNNSVQSPDISPSPSPTASPALEKVNQ